MYDGKFLKFRPLELENSIYKTCRGIPRRRWNAKIRRKNSEPTVDGRNPKQPPEMYKTRRKSWDNLSINWWTPDFWTINRITVFCSRMWRHDTFHKAMLPVTRSPEFTHMRKSLGKIPRMFNGKYIHRLIHGFWFFQPVMLVSGRVCVFFLESFSLNKNPKSEGHDLRSAHRCAKWYM